MQNTFLTQNVINDSKKNQHLHFFLKKFFATPLFNFKNNKVSVKVIQCAQLFWVKNVFFQVIAIKKFIHKTTKKHSFLFKISNRNCYFFKIQKIFSNFNTSLPNTIKHVSPLIFFLCRFHFVWFNFLICLLKLQKNLCNFITSTNFSIFFKNNCKLMGFKSHALTNLKLPLNLLLSNSANL